MKPLFGNPTSPGWKNGPTDWFSVIGEEMQVTWGQLERFRFELPELRFMRGQTIWMESTLDDLRERRRAVLGMARSAIGDGQDGALDALWPLIAVDTISPSLASAICHAYVNAPVRIFSDVSGVDEGFDGLYEELEVNETMNAAYRSALFTNTVFIYWDGECFKPLTPEYFRLTEDQDGEPELWLCRRERDGIYFDVWNNLIHTTRKGENGSVIKTEENPYGQFPGVMLRLNKSNDTYGAGITEAADLNAASNLVMLFAMRTALYQGFSIGVASNFGSAIAAGAKIGPGSFLTPNNRQGEASTAPKLEFVTPDGKFEELQKFKQDRIGAFKRNQDLPGYLVDGVGVPPTGVALQVAERQINTKRREHQLALRSAERDMAGFVSILAAQRKRDLVANTFSIKYAEPEMFNDPASALAYDLDLARNGQISPSALYQKYFGVQKGMTDADAVTAMKANQAAFSFLAPPVPIKPPATV